MSGAMVGSGSRALLGAGACLRTPPSRQLRSCAHTHPPPPRLLHYFRGRHHLEEIMYNENTRRSQLLALVDKFRSVLVVTTHEDPVITVFQALLT